MRTDRWIGHNIVCLLLYLAVNALFVGVYAGRILPQPWLFAGLYTVVAGAVVLMGRQLIRNRRHGARNAKWLAAVCCAATVGMLLTQCLTDPYTLQIDRWSALHNMTDNILNGEYPYNARTHKGSPVDPFPVQWAIHVPFYFMGNVGLGFFVMLFLFLWSVWAIQGRRAMVLVLLLLTLAPAVWYEAICRSDYMSNMFLTAAAVNYGAKHMNEMWLRRHWAVVAVAIGVLGGTRIITLLPCGILLFSFWLHLGWKRKAGMIVVFMVTLAAMFAPFALWNPYVFFVAGFGPIKMQSFWIPGWGYAAITALAVGSSLLWRGDRRQLYALIAVMLELCVMTSYIYLSLYHGQNWKLTNFSITYFSTCIPFAIMSICERDNDGRCVRTSEAY